MFVDGLSRWGISPWVIRNKVEERKDLVLNALRYYDHRRFKGIYEKLCTDYNLQHFGFEEAASMYSATFEESSVKKLDHEQEKPSDGKQGKLKDYRKEGLNKQDKIIKPLASKKTNSKKNQKKKSANAAPISFLSERNLAESKEIGDKAEDIVKFLLEKSSNEIKKDYSQFDQYPFNLQWDVVNTNQKYRDNFQYYDLEATREGKRLRVEVKGTREQWSSVALTPTEIKWAYKTVEDEKEEDLLLEYWICIVENVFGDYTITPINWSKQSSNTEILFKRTTWEK